MTDDAELEAIRARHEAGEQDDQHDGWTVRHGWKAHTDRATLLALLDAERARVKALCEAAGNLIRTWQERNPVRTADFHPAPCDCYRCLYDTLSRAVAEAEGG